MINPMPRRAGVLTVYDDRDNDILGSGGRVNRQDKVEQRDGRRLRVTALIVGCAIITATTCVVAKAEIDATPQASALQKALYAKDIDSKNGRSNLANSLGAYCDSLFTQVPSNTPQEDRWVDDELKEIGFLTGSPGWIPRMNRLMNSKENARKSLRRVFSECSSLTKEILSVPKSSAAEALLWLTLAGFFSSEDELWRLADIVGLVSKNECRKERIMMSEMFEGAGLDPIGAPVTISSDKNKLCSSSSIHNTIFLHALEPLLKEAASSSGR
jgi:hypothetical protein